MTSPPVRAPEAPLVSIIVVCCAQAEFLAEAVDSALRQEPPVEVVVVDGANPDPLEVPQATAVFGLPGVMRHDPDFIPGYVANYILGGGGFSSRLMEEVRVKRGLTYGVSTSLSSYNKAAVMQGSVATRANAIRVPRIATSKLWSLRGHIDPALIIDKLVDNTKRVSVEIVATFVPMQIKGEISRLLGIIGFPYDHRGRLSGNGRIMSAGAQAASTTCRIAGQRLN